MAVSVQVKLIMGLIVIGLILEMSPTSIFVTQAAFPGQSWLFKTLGIPEVNDTETIEKICEKMSSACEEFISKYDPINDFINMTPCDSIMSFKNRASETKDAIYKFFGLDEPFVCGNVNAICKLLYSFKCIPSSNIKKETI